MPSFRATIRATAVVLVVGALATVEIAPAQAGRFPERRALNRGVRGPIGIPGRWRLVLNSVFSGRRLPPHWRTGWFGGGVTSPVNSSELACYSPANVSFPGDGTMHLDVSPAPSRCGGLLRPYTGAMVSTDPIDGRRGTGFQYTYGVLQARVYIPAAAGLIADWPAVWTDGQSWPVDGEDDLMEGLNGTACFHFHDQSGAPGGCDRHLAPGWHTFASDWRPGVVTYYYDGARVGAVATGVTAAPMYLLIDNTVSPRGSRVTAPASMRVQYVRVWQLS